MAYFSGQQGELWIDGKKAARVQGWEFSTSVATLDTTSLGDTDRTVTPGIRSTTGNCTLFYYEENTGAKGDASTLLSKVIKARLSGQGPGVAGAPEKVMLKLRVADGTTAGRYITGEAVITSASMSMAVGSILSAQVAFELNGAPTEVNL
jgi:hypothetical protein